MALTDGEFCIVRNLRTKFQDVENGVIANYNDREVMNAYDGWSTSDDAGDEGKLIAWLGINDY